MTYRKLAALTAALALLAAALVVGRATGQAGTHHSPNFIAQHTNAILRHKCRATYKNLGGGYKTWLRRHLLAHKAPRRRCTPVSRPAVGGSEALATWYGPGFYGHGAACGATLTSGSMWVAHRTLPCGTHLIVCSRVCVHTYVGDRGPYSAATFDLAPGLARALGCYCTQTVRWRFG